MILSAVYINYHIHLLLYVNLCLLFTIEKAINNGGV